jgi:putative beta-barrel porin BBP2
VKAFSLTRQTIASALVLLATCVPAPAHAQGPSEGAPDPGKVRVRIGPLMLNPTISLTNAGIDENVFNEPVDQQPKRDFTFTVSPTTDIWLRIGRTWLSGNITESINWYQKYASERTANNSYAIGWRVPLNRLTFKVNAQYLKARERPGFEIDLRAQRNELVYDGAVELRALSKTFFGATVNRRRVDFAEGNVFLGSNLHDELNRVSTTAGFTLRHQLTPLTSVGLIATRADDQFEFSPLRDSKTTAVAATLMLDPFALIKGTASFGFENFQPASPDLISYNGTTAAVTLTYTLLGATRFTVDANRNVEYSYDVNQPYYLKTGFGGSIAQQVFGPVDVVGRLNTQNLAYRDRAGAVIEVSNRTDRVRLYGVGVGYRMGKELRLGFNIDNTSRTSAVSRRQYEGLKFGTAITYGL